MFGRRINKAPVRQVVGPRPGANSNCCVRTVPGQQPAQRPVVRPVQRPNPFVKR
jgi:hypothetical protein